MALITAAFDGAERAQHNAVGVSVHYVGTATCLLGVAAWILRARAMRIANALISADRAAYEAAWRRVLDAQAAQIAELAQVCAHHTYIHT